MQEQGTVYDLEEAELCYGEILAFRWGFVVVLFALPLLGLCLDLSSIVDTPSPLPSPPASWPASAPVPPPNSSPVRLGQGRPQPGGHGGLQQPQRGPPHRAVVRAHTGSRRTALAGAHDETGKGARRREAQLKGLRVYGRRALSVGASASPRAWLGPTPLLGPYPTYTHAHPFTPPPGTTCRACKQRSPRAPRCWLTSGR